MIYIYLIGFICSYIYLRYVKRRESCPGCNYKYCDNHYSWGSVVIVFLLSILSWLSFIAVLILEIIMKIDKSKPPKWL